MKIPCNEYQFAYTVEQALTLLHEASGIARIISGGSDLLLELQQGDCPPVDLLVDVTQVDELCALEIRNRSLFIGASVTLTRIINSPLVKMHAQALQDAALLMANPQVCNVATIGGNVAHALPAADGTIALLALDATAEIAGTTVRRRIPLIELFKGPGVSSLDSCRDLLVGFYLPLCGRGGASAFTRRVNPQGIALAMLNMAIWLKRDHELIRDIHISVGPSGPTPLRMSNTENVLRNQIQSSQLKARALEAILAEAHFRSSPHRATAEYRSHLAGILFEEVLSTAWARAGETHQ
jgi:CO/xanthine dehydrogenase FAD-binding subunit